MTSSLVHPKGKRTWILVPEPAVASDIASWQVDNGICSYDNGGALLA